MCHERNPFIYPWTKINTWVKSETHTLAQEIRMRTKTVWPACRRALTYIHSVESTAICAITFSVFLSRVIWVSTRIRHDGILPSKTAETPPHKSAGLPRWFIYLLRGIELPLSTARRKWVCAYCIRKPGNCFRRNACYNITNVCGIKYLNGNSSSSSSMSMIHILTLR